ncbi:alpha/beta hydrolase family protein [Rubrimonas cliftonensis]|uniref:Serine aminopeptidase S33 domain-containing protein n=1 Tax=Rubrimonas cliftonensis TaxID=89524 RepID=A0A1H3YRF6_9RHOB|nr:alpha/beta fold hydrolase [Rubrimonas cliftonensis]SEA13791.1 hypothetical protein SAMN05444370_103204 [Rubrimonas cliftonensis]
MVFLLSTGAAAGAGLDACPPAPARHAAAAERTLRIETPDGRIAATFARPEGVEPAALALMLHGYTGARDEFPVQGGEGMFARAARAFAERGVASLRIDFIGSGESDGAWADTTFETQARDALRARDFLAATVGREGAPLGVLGFSQGGLVALKAAREGGFDRVALWNPVLAPRETYRAIFGDALDAGFAAAAEGPGGAQVAGTGLRPGFFAGVAAADPAADAVAIAAPLLAVSGARDMLAAQGPARAEALAAARAAPTTAVAVAGGHDLGAVGEPALLDAVIACTAGFLLGLAPRP